MNVELGVASLLDAAADVAEMLASEELTPEKHEAIVAATRRFQQHSRELHVALDEQIQRTLGHQVGLRNDSFKEREELELAVLKAKHLLQLLQTDGEN